MNVPHKKSPGAAATASRAHIDNVHAPNIDCCARRVNGEFQHQDHSGQNPFGMCPETYKACFVDFADVAHALRWGEAFTADMAVRRFRSAVFKSEAYRKPVMQELAHDPARH